MKYLPIEQELFIENRKKFVAQMKPNSIAIFNSNDEMPRSADLNHPWRQNPDLFYLSGIDQEETFLILYPDSPRKEYREVLFVRETNEHIAVWEGHKYTMEEAQQASGITTVLWNKDFHTVLSLLMVYAETVYLNSNENDRASITVQSRDNRFANDLQTRFPLHHYERSARILNRLRALKSPAEVALIKEAVSITEKAFRRILGYVKPGVMEYEVEAEIMHEFLRNRATTYAYYPIIASGKNACVLHYVENNQPCNAGDMLLLDFGCEYANYASDLTRTIPVSGKFTKRQKDIYNAVLRVMKEAKKLLKPGTVLWDYNIAVGWIMQEELLGLGLLKKEEVAKQHPDRPLFKKYFPHGTSHFMGIDVHDIGDRFGPMLPGMVFTCEPGIYVPEEGIGIRIENDVLITENGNMDFMENFPIEAEEIEMMMAK